MIDDTDVLRRVDTALRQHPHLRSALIAPRQAEDRVVLEGSVDSFFLKQMAQEAIRPIAGNQRIDNRLQVQTRSHVCSTPESSPVTAVAATAVETAAINLTPVQ